MQVVIVVIQPDGAETRSVSDLRAYSMGFGGLGSGGNERKAYGHAGHRRNFRSSDTRWPMSERKSR